MTNFNPKNQHKSNDEWAELALQKSANSNTQYHVIGGLFGSVFLAGATSPLTGLILGAWVIWSAWCKSGDNARNKEHIINSRCIANTLEGDDFHFYRDQYGDDAVAEQLQFAEKLNLGLSNDALDFLEDYEALKSKPAASPNRARGVNYGGSAFKPPARGRFSLWLRGTATRNGFQFRTPRKYPSRGMEPGAR